MSLRSRIRGYVDKSIDRADKSKALEVGEGSWHYRLYNWWMSMGGHNKRGYRENFCHYVRVVLIWVPLFWFFKYRISGTWIRPWMVAALTASIAFLAAIYILAPNVFWTGVVIVAFFAALIGVFIGIFFLDDYMYHKHYVGWKNFKRKLSDFALIAFLVITFPISVPLGLLLFLDIQIEKRYNQSGWEWFFTHRYLKIVFPWMPVLVAAIAASLYFFGLDKTLWGLAIIIGFILGVVGIIALVFGLAFLYIKSRDWRREKLWAIQDRIHSARPHRVVPEKPKGTPFWQLALAFALSKKRKICPFIALPNAPSQPVKPDFSFDY